MPRRSKRVTITATGRDQGKTFELKEMPADQGERWATRAIIALANGGARLPEGALDLGGMAGLEWTWRNVVALSLTAIQGLHFADIAPLLDEMKHFISFCPELPNAPPQPLFTGENCQIEEVQTWFELRYALLELHLGFSLAGTLSTSDTTPETAPA